MPGTTNYKVVLITSGQPSLNPRLVKEADTLINTGHDVTVIYQYRTDWGTELDKNLLPKKKWKIIRVGGSPDHDVFIYWLSRAMHKTGLILSRMFGLKHNVAEIAIGRCAPLLTSTASKYQADLYVAHNLAALPAAVRAAKKNRAKCSFDAEDFHRNETSDNQADADVILKTFIENKYIPKVDFLSTSSPGISALYQKIFPEKVPVSILNVCTLDNHISYPQPNPNKTLRLFWFSQTIGASRGIEDVIEALNILKTFDIELHLLGSVSVQFKQTLINDTDKRSCLHFHEPIPPDEISLFASQFDIGLALEPGFSINNKFALSNKIFSYLQAGLAIIASSTPAQAAFMNQYPETGDIYGPGKAKALSEIIMRHHLNRGNLYRAKKASFELARKKMNWENESQIFLNAVKTQLGN